MHRDNCHDGLEAAHDDDGLLPVTVTTSPSLPGARTPGGGVTVSLSVKLAITKWPSSGQLELQVLDCSHQLSNLAMTIPRADGASAAASRFF